MSLLKILHETTTRFSKVLKTLQARNEEIKYYEKNS